MGYYRRIRDLREDHDLTQRQLAAKLGMTQTQYFRYEQGYRDVPSDITRPPPTIFWGAPTTPGFSAEAAGRENGDGRKFPCQGWKDMVYYKRSKIEG